jgi:toxin ParE1/3/4
MKPTVVIRPRADADLDEQVEYIAQQSPRAARRFYDAAEAAFELLPRMPEMGGCCEFSNPAAATCRMWPIRGFEKHVIFYRPTEMGFEVVRVLHAARDIETIFED